jgi:hypothetical protein
VAVNTQNKDTLELRVFASSLDPALVKAALAFAAASVEYTRDPVNPLGWDDFARWVSTRADYAPLTRELRRLDLLPEPPPGGHPIPAAMAEDPDAALTEETLTDDLPAAHRAEVLGVLATMEEFLRPVEDFVPSLRFDAIAVRVLDLDLTDHRLEPIRDVLGHTAVVDWPERGIKVMTKEMLAEIRRHRGEGRLRLDSWNDVLFGTPGLALRIRAARTLGLDLTLEQVAAGRLTGPGLSWSGWAPIQEPDGGVIWELKTPFGVVVMTGEQFSQPDDPHLAPAAIALRFLVGHGYRWARRQLKLAELPERMLALVAHAAALPPVQVHEVGGFRVARVRFDEPIGSLAGGASTKYVDLAIWRRKDGRLLLVGFNPVDPTLPVGLVASPDLLASARDRAVAFRKAGGKIVATGVALREATLTAHHVAAAQRRLDLTAGGARFTEARTLEPDDYGVLGPMARRGRDWSTRDFSADEVPPGPDIATIPLALARGRNVRLRSEPLRPDEVLTFVSYSGGQMIITQGTVLEVRDGHAVVDVMLSGAASGTGVYDRDDQLVGLVITANAKFTVVMGPELTRVFVTWTVSRKRGRRVAQADERDATAKPARAGRAEADKPATVKRPATVEEALEAARAAAASLAPPRRGPWPGSLRAVLELLEGNPRVSAEQVRVAALPVGATSAVLGRLAELNLLHSIDQTYSSDAWVSELTRRVAARATLPRGSLRDLLVEVDRLWSPSPALWSERTWALTKRLLDVLGGVPELSGPPPGPARSGPPPGRTLRAMFEVMLALDAPFSITEVARRTGAHPDVIGDRLRTLTRWDVVERGSGRGRYWIPDETRQAIIAARTPDTPALSELAAVLDLPAALGPSKTTERVRKAFIEVGLATPDEPTTTPSAPRPGDPRAPPTHGAPDSPASEPPSDGGRR